MPEFVIEKRNIPVLTIASNDGPAGGSAGENPLGFRITGGADFEMPITVFQVKEDSAAAKAGLKLGDQIVTINGADASAMRLATAESVIKQAGEQLQLVVTKDEEEVKDPHSPAAQDAEPKPKQPETREITFAVSPPPKSPPSSMSRSVTPGSPDRCTRSHSCESCESFANAAVVEEQLRQMQKQLNEISIIPMQIQATLSYLTKTISKFVPPEMQREMPASMRGGSCVRDETIIEECEDQEDSDGDGEDGQREEEWADQEDGDEPEEEDNLAGCFERMFDESKNCFEEEPTDDGFGSDEEPEISEEERLRLEKVERVSKLERSWPWSETAKPMHKRSNCHVVPSKTKIKQLDELPFYKRGFQQRFGN